MTQVALLAHIMQNSLIKRRGRVPKGGPVSIETKDMMTEKQPGEAVPRPSPYPSLPTLPKESRLVTFGDRVTYTFTHGKEVGSIHYDRSRHEIFYKGHNIRHMEMEEWQWQMMEKFRQVLRGDAKCNSFVESYGQTLDKVVLEKTRSTK